MVKWRVSLCNICPTNLDEVLIAFNSGGLGDISMGKPFVPQLCRGFVRFCWLIEIARAILQMCSFLHLETSMTLFLCHPISHHIPRFG